MPAYAVVGGVYVLTKLAGTLQKYLFEPLVGAPIRKAHDALRAAEKKAKGEDLKKILKARAGLDIVISTWDWAISIAYDDPVELAADVAALGVKLNLLTRGVPVLQRLLTAGGTKIAVHGVEVALNAISLLAGGVGAVPKGLSRFAERFLETDALIDWGADLAGEGLDVLGAATNFALDLAQGKLPVKAAHNLGVQLGEWIGSLLGFTKAAEEHFFPLGGVRRLGGFEPGSLAAGPLTDPAFSQQLPPVGPGPPPTARPKGAGPAGRWVRPSGLSEIANAVLDRLGEGPSIPAPAQTAQPSGNLRRDILRSGGGGLAGLLQELKGLALNGMFLFASRGAGGAWEGPGPPPGPGSGGPFPGGDLPR